MAKINVLAGDFLQGEGHYESGVITIETALYPWPGLTIPVSEIRTMQVASETARKHPESALGLSLAGAMFLGPVGAVAGLVLAKDTVEVTFWAELKDGRKLLGATDPMTYHTMESCTRRPGFLSAHGE
ncbi:hypothetical protein [Pseudomonas sp. NA-150]|uniref:hypothetical protein n=1 Tax=Pseudomonas sp. NA-150 TaxID=3367525 RepID=UPI0037C53505